MSSKTCGFIVNLDPGMDKEARGRLVSYLTVLRPVAEIDALNDDPVIQIAAAKSRIQMREKVESVVGRPWEMVRGVSDRLLLTLDGNYYSDHGEFFAGCIKQQAGVVSVETIETDFDLINAVTENTREWQRQLHALLA